MSDDALNMVDQLLSNEGVSPNKKSKKVAKKRAFKKKPVSGPGEVELNSKYDPDAPQEYWPGDTIKLTKDMREKARLPDDAFMVCSQTPTMFRQASVYCPWYSIYGWGASTRDAMEACAQNIADYWKRFPDKAQEILDNFKGYKPLKRSLRELKQEAEKSMADILEGEGL